MPKLKQLTGNSYFVTTVHGEKMGVLIDNTDKNIEESINKYGYSLYTMEGVLELESLEELEQITGSNVEYVEVKKEEFSTVSQMLDDYPINSTDNVHDVERDAVLGIPTFRKTTRVNVRYYPGWFIIKNGSGQYVPKLTLSIRNYEERKEKNEVHGPYKTYTMMSVDLGKLQ